MVQESESRFCSDQQTILQALDPIHRSLLINNSAFDGINTTTSSTDNPLNQLPTCELFEQQQQVQLQQQQQTQQENQHRKNSIENKHFYDASVPAKPDVTCVSGDSNCLVLFHAEHSMSDELECAAPSDDKKSNSNDSHSRKNIQIRIMTNKKRSCGRAEKSRERMSSESPTDSSTYESTYEYVDTDSEVESSSGTANEHFVNSGGSTTTDELSDYNDFNNCESSSNDEATTSSSTSNSNAPMIQIVQEITEQRMVVSTVQVNKKKIRSFQKTNVNRVTVSSKAKPQWKNKQKIIDDNVCNEILDETINWNVIDGEQPNNAVEPPPVADTIVLGELKAKPKYSQRKMGKLMERRLSRVLSDNVSPITPNQRNQSAIDASSDVQPIHRSSVPPAKPPRTFTSSSSKTSSESIGANTATTLRIEDCHRSSTIQHAPQMSPGGGWIFDKSYKPTTKPTCPALDDMNEFENPRKIGWVSLIPEQRQEIFHVLNMLNDDNRMASKITSANLTPEPQQFPVPCKEDIDQVDSSIPPKPALRRSKKMAMELNDSMCSSTPVKRTNNFSSHSMPHATRSDVEICKKCKLEIIQPSSVRKSFGKGAIKRTKLFFKASKNMLIKPKPMQPTNRLYDSNSSENEYYVELPDDVDETPTKLKLNSTADFNTDNTPKFEKKTEKTLDLSTPRQSENVNDGPRRILDKLLTTVKRTPPKKPARQSLAHKDVTRSPSNNEEENFNFDRTVDSPKGIEREKSFKLSPRKLFFSASERSNRMQDNTYRSFGTDQSDELKQCIVEYLRNMNEKIEHRSQGEVECATVPRWRSPRARNFSTSSDAIDYVPQRQRVVQIDCHPEPLYSDIVVQPASTLSHIIVNDDPKAIYATVNKTKHQKPVAPLTVKIDDDENRTANEEAIRKSWNSEEELSINNNFAESVLNLLALMKQQNLDGEGDVDSPTPEIDDRKPATHCSQVKNSYVVEPPAVQLTSERFQQSSVSRANDKAFDDNTSMDTFRTESLCDDVIRGDSANRNIVATFDRLENLDTAIDLVEPETDDDDIGDDSDRTICIDHRAAVMMDSDEDSTDYCSIVGENCAMDAAESWNEKSLHFTTTGESTSSAYRKNRNLQSPLVAAPSMIEINDQFMMKLTNQITAQREIRNQLKHAIQICRTTKEFESSSEMIEAERLMLLSGKKEQCAKLELTRIDYEENGLTVSPAKCVGMVTIKKIEFDLKPEEMLEQIFQLSYICICSYRDQVVSTHSQERTGNKVEFNDIGIKIGSLTSAFEIKIEIYVLRLPRPLRKYSHESKYHLNKISKKPSLFPNPVKLFSGSSISNTKSAPDSEETRFRLRGFATISAQCLSSEKFEIVRNGSWPKNHVYISYNTKTLNLEIKDQFTNMTGALRTEFICEINLRDSGMTGFLSVKEENGTEREMWCRLIGCTMEFWSSDIDCLNGKTTVLSIDLTKCTNELFACINDRFPVDIFNEDVVVGQADRRRINRYWMGAHNRNDLILWLTELNRILKFVKDWNI